MGLQIFLPKLAEESFHIVFRSAEIIDSTQIVDSTVIDNIHSEITCCTMVGTESSLLSVYLITKDRD